MSLAVEPTYTSTTLTRSRRYCAELTRRQARNFYYGLKLLPQPQRGSMFALYAYMRLADDIADGDARPHHQRLEDLERFRRQTHAALGGDDLSSTTDETAYLWPAFTEMVRRHNVPAHVFDDVIEGQRQDLQPLEFQTFDQLKQYCHHVAGVVGLASIHIWNFTGGQETESMALDRGIAFQLTNILRDLREDAARGRTYLPQDELKQFKVTSSDLLTGRGSENFLNLMRFQIDRARAYYESSRALDERIDAASRPTLVAMTEIYHSILEKVAADPQRVLRERVSLSPLHKLRIGWRALRSR